MTETFDAPQSRNEAILQNILGADNDLITPESRIEALLQAILEQGALETKNFELIETITITDDNVNDIERTDYDYKKVFIRGRIAAGEGGTTQTYINDFSCGWWSENENGGVGDTFGEIMNGMFFCVYSSQLTPLDNPGGNTPLVRRERSFGQMIEGNITSIEITSTKYFPVGTVFEIYAV